MFLFVTDAKWKLYRMHTIIQKFIWMNSPLSQLYTGINIDLGLIFVWFAGVSVCFCLQAMAMYTFLYFVNSSTKQPDINALYIPPCSNGAGTMKDVNGFHVQNNKLRPIPHPVVFVSRLSSLNLLIILSLSLTTIDFMFTGIRWFYVSSYFEMISVGLNMFVFFFTSSLISFQRSLRTGDFENQFPFLSLKTHETYYVCWANTNCIRAAQEAPIVTWQLVESIQWNG